MKMNVQFEQNEKDNFLSNPENYKWGIFYFNTQDSRSIIQKKSSWMGLIFNFASRKTYLILLGIIVILIGIVVFSIQGEI